jgi:hypothetical protein
MDKDDGSYSYFYIGGTENFLNFKLGFNNHEFSYTIKNEIPKQVPKSKPKTKKIKNNEIIKNNKY